MKIIISLAKKMIIDNDFLGHKKMPVLLEETRTLLDYLQTLSYEESKSIWKCSDKLAENNIESPDGIKDFNRSHYTYKEELSDENNYVFIKTEIYG